MNSPDFEGMRVIFEDQTMGGTDARPDKSEIYTCNFHLRPYLPYPHPTLMFRKLAISRCTHGKGLNFIHSSHYLLISIFPSHHEVFSPDLFPLFFPGYLPLIINNPSQPLPPTRRPSTRLFLCTGFPHFIPPHGSRLSASTTWSTATVPSWRYYNYYHHHRLQ